MANQDVCPWCGLPFDKRFPFPPLYECGSDPGWEGEESRQSELCKKIAQLKAKVETVALAVKKMDPMVREILNEWADTPNNYPIDQWMNDLSVVSLLIGVALGALKEASDA